MRSPTPCFLPPTADETSARYQKMTLSRPLSSRYACTLDGNTVVLDLESERYFAITTTDSQAIADALRSQQGHLECHEGRLKMGNLLPLSNDAVCTRINTGRALSVGTTIICALIRLKLFGPNRAIGELHRRLQSTERSLSQFQKPALAAEVATFRRIRPWFYTARNNCLFNALILASHLTRIGYYPTVAIGVRLRPFLAHAWVQVDDYVIDDTPENVQSYSPIFVM